MGGQSAIRGFLLQTLIAVLRSLDATFEWSRLQLEPDEASEKVDILWTLPDDTKTAVQVKSSENRIAFPVAKRWANDLKTKYSANDYELQLLGPVSDEMTRTRAIDGVKIPTPKNIDEKGLFSEAAHELDVLLDASGIATRPEHREIIIKAFCSELLGGSIHGKEYDASAVRELFASWANQFRFDPDLRDIATTLQETARDSMANALSTDEASVAHSDAMPQLEDTRPPDPLLAQPYPLQEHFTGRLTERRILTEWLKERRIPILLLSALGGTGKSALAWVWLKVDVCNLDSNLGYNDPDVSVPESLRPATIVWWSFYSERAGFPRFIEATHDYLFGKRSATEGMTRFDMMERILREARSRRVLLVLDGFERELWLYARESHGISRETVQNRGDATDRCIDPNASTFLEQFAALPGSSQLLITTRDVPGELKCKSGVLTHWLEGLSKEDAVTFFRRQEIRGPEHQIHDLCGSYGYHGLSLRLLTGIIRNHPEYPLDVLAATNARINSELKGPHGNHILNVAYEQLDNRHRSLLARIAAFRTPTTYAQVRFVAKSFRDVALHNALTALVDRGLLFFNPDSAHFSLHPVVQDHAYRKLRNKRDVHLRIAQYLVGKTDRAIASVAPATIDPRLEPSTQQMSVTRDELEILVQLMTHQALGGLFAESLGLFRNELFTPLYYHFGEYANCIQLCSLFFPKGLRSAPRVTTNEDRAWLCNSLANVYIQYGQPSLSEELFRQCIHIHATDGQHNEQSTALGNLAQAQLVLGKLRSAERNLRTALRMCGESRPDVALRDSELGHLLTYLGRFEEAHSLLSRSEKYWRSVNKPEGIFLIAANWSVYHLMQRELKQSHEFAKIARDTSVEGKTSPRRHTHADILIAWTKVAIASQSNLNERDLIVESGRLLEEAIRRARTIQLVDLEPHALIGLAYWHCLRGKIEEADQCARDAAERTNRLCYPFLAAHAYNLLARIAFAEGRLDDCIANAEHAKRHAVGQEPPHSFYLPLRDADRLLAAGRKELRFEPQLGVSLGRGIVRRAFTQDASEVL